MSEFTGKTTGMKNEATLSGSGAVRRSSRRRPVEAQLDFTLPAEPPAPRRSLAPGARPCSRERARWWFNQMRQVVDEGRTVEVAGVF
jgi:hypothetical protein